jgi:N utilization substance protein B
MQAVYQWQLTGMDLREISTQFACSDEFRGADPDYFRDLLHGVGTSVDELDLELSRSLDRDIEKIDPVELAIMRISTFELLHKPEVPVRVILNEAVALTRKFGAEQGHTYVNGVLDKVAHRLRAGEFAGNGS